MNLLDKYKSKMNQRTNRETDRATLQKTFDSLFQEHMAFLRGHSTTLDQIKQHSPEIAEELVALSKAMDVAWFKEDLPAFKLAMQQLEAWYLQAHKQIAGKEATR